MLWIDEYYIAIMITLIVFCF